ncbi:hypothetical protein KUTeg_006758 [Tegillarca granosa]|uniref:Schlafen AlbA-2 domain-containing protein n=1 Tax=Tegillarca granosa TaxID=220873 RepID=A0ABQ9FG02_TEGGR|nr:hypothetical protein KUTeg_006758 [Tegillarca granosa]
MSKKLYRKTADLFKEWLKIKHFFFKTFQQISPLLINIFKKSYHFKFCKKNTWKCLRGKLIKFYAYLQRKRNFKDTDEEPISKYRKNSNIVDETTFSTNFVQMEINGETDKARDYKQSFMKNICALANSGGGVLCIKNTAKSIAFADFDNIMQNGKCWLHKIGHSGFENLVEFKPPTNKHGSALLVTTCMNTYDSHVNDSWKTENMLKVINDITESASTKSKVPKPIMAIKDDVTYLQQFPGESIGLEYKGCEKIKNLKSLLHTMFEKKDKKGSLIQYICRFSKTGGSIIYGITESKTTSKIYRAEGINFLLSKTDESEIEDHCRSKIKTTMLWLTHEGKILETDKIDAYICFIFHPMKCMGVKKNYKILEIAVAPFHGIVFDSISGPEAWRVDPKSSQINRIETVDWYRCMRKQIPLCEHIRKLFGVVTLTLS